MKREHRRGGFTVVELLLGIGLFGLVAPSISLAILAINDVNDRAADLTYANILAENKIETLRSAGYNTLTDGSIDFTAELPDTLTAPKSATYVVTSPETGLKKIVVTIQYTDNGDLKTLSYGSMMSELGVAQ